MSVNLIEQAAQHKDKLRQNIQDSFNPLPQQSFEQLAKSEETHLDDLEKAKRITARIGEIRTHGGREYIRTISGWKYHGKGTGSKAKEHKESTTSSSEKKEDTADKKTTTESTETKTSKTKAKEGEIRKRGQNNYILKDGQWKYHSRYKEESVKNDISETTSGRHIGDMTPTEKKAAAKQLGIDIEGKSTKQIDEELTGKNVERALQEWKEKRKEASKKPTSQQVTDAISKVGEALASKKSADTISALRDEAKRLGAAYGMSNEKIDEAISTSRKGHESAGK